MAGLAIIYPVFYSFGFGFLGGLGIGLFVSRPIVWNLLQYSGMISICGGLCISGAYKYNLSFGDSKGNINWVPILSLGAISIGTSFSSGSFAGILSTYIARGFLYCLML